MPLTLKNVNAVVIAHDHNPSILHPAFLQGEGIVPKEWTPSEAPICTPPFSRVVFEERFEFIVEQNRLQVKDHNPPEDLSACIVPRLAADYINKLPYVNYAAVGLNFSALVHKNDPGVYIRDTFLRGGPWNDGDNPVTSAEVKLFYLVDRARLTLSLAPNSSKGRQGATGSTGVTVDANYHTDVEGHRALEDSSETLKGFAERSRHYVWLANKIMGE